MFILYTFCSIIKLKEILFLYIFLEKFIKIRKKYIDSVNNLYKFKNRFKQIFDTLEN
jgi:hypothetical protein